MYLPPTEFINPRPDRRDQDRTLRKAEAYELARALREADELARRERTTRRTRHLGPRDPHRRTLGARLTLVLRRA